jgi:methylthioribose-1-phosphate isomerase
MNILCVGIPVKPLVEKMIARHGEELTIFVPELRPFEKHVSDAIGALEEDNVSIVVMTDNMVGALFQNREIGAVYSTYTAKTGGCYVSMPGAHIAAVVASECATPFYVVKAKIPEGVTNSHFFGKNIAVEGAHTADFQLDNVPEALVTESIA